MSNFHQRQSSKCRGLLARQVSPQDSVGRLQPVPDTCGPRNKFHLLRHSKNLNVARMLGHSSFSSWRPCLRPLSVPTFSTQEAKTVSAVCLSWHWVSHSNYGKCCLYAPASHRIETCSKCTVSQSQNGLTSIQSTGATDEQGDKVLHL